MADRRVPMVVRLPAGMILDGAVVELGRDEDGVIADLRIPAPESQL